MGLTLRFPKTIWNAHATTLPPRLSLPQYPVPPSTPNLSPTKKSFRTKKRTVRAPSSSLSSIPTCFPSLPPRSPLTCKVKLHRFHHGGPQRARRGRMQHVVTLDEPCFRATCGNCWTLQGKEMRMLHGVLNCVGVVGAAQGQRLEVKTEERVEAILEERMQEAPADSVIDPRILDGSWRRFKSADLSMVTSVAAPAMHLHALPETEAEAELLLTPVRRTFGSYQPEVVPLIQTPVSQWEAVRPTKVPDIYRGDTGAKWVKVGRRKGIKISTEDQKLKKREYDRKRRERMKMGRK